ncbi:MAG: BrnT family toxin [Lachnospiraceae bacterium]|jgi:uncharacterized DUF497 family protein|nr:BrnT family toxin [Lachnospiraceae bacterium]
MAVSFRVFCFSISQLAAKAKVLEILFYLVLDEGVWYSKQKERGGQRTLPEHEYFHHGMIIRWNEYKAEINQKKHGVTFEEAATAFRDVNAQLYRDDEHSTDEDHFILLGYSVISRLLMVCHCYRDNDSTIRIISARKATRQERQKYEERRET